MEYLSLIKHKKLSDDLSTPRFEGFDDLYSDYLLNCANHHSYLSTFSLDNDLCNSERSSKEFQCLECEVNIEDTEICAKYFCAYWYGYSDDGISGQSVRLSKYVLHCTKDILRLFRTGKNILE